MVDCTSSFLFSYPRYLMTGFYLRMHYDAQTTQNPLCYRIRGRLGSVFVLSTGAGILFAYTCGTFFSYTTLPFIYIPLSFLFLIGTIFHPESAHFLVKKEKNDVSRVGEVVERVDNVFGLKPLPAQQS